MHFLLLSLLITCRIYVRRSAGKFHEWPRNDRLALLRRLRAPCEGAFIVDPLAKWNSISSRFLGRFKTINSRAAISWIFRKWKSYLERSSSPDEQIYFPSSLARPFRIHETDRRGTISISLNLINILNSHADLSRNNRDIQTFQRKRESLSLSVLFSGSN